MFFRDSNDKQQRLEYFESRCASLLKIKSVSSDLSMRQEDCVLSNEMAARRKNIQKRCNLKLKQKFNTKLEALNIIPMVGQKTLTVAPLIDTSRLYVLKYRCR